MHSIIRVRALFLGLLIFFVIASPLCAQVAGIGFGGKYDYGLPVPDVVGHRVYENGSIATVGGEVFVTVPIGFLDVQPAFQKAFGMRDILMDNLDGEYIPQGYIWDRAIVGQAPDFVETEEYEDLSSDISYSETVWGTYILLPLPLGAAIGSGWFRARQSVEVSTEIYTDGYRLEGFNANGSYRYGYVDTQFAGIRTTTQTSTTNRVPLVLRLKTGGNAIHSEASVVYWLNSDNYWSFRYSIFIRI